MASKVAQKEKRIGEEKSASPDNDLGDSVEDSYPFFGSHFLFSFCKF